MESTGCTPLHRCDVRDRAEGPRCRPDPRHAVVAGDRAIGADRAARSRRRPSDHSCGAAVPSQQARGERGGGHPRPTSAGAALRSERQAGQQQATECRAARLSPGTSFQIVVANTPDEGQQRQQHRRRSTPPGGRRLSSPISVTTTWTNQPSATATSSVWISEVVAGVWPPSEVSQTNAVPGTGWWLVQCPERICPHWSRESALIPPGSNATHQTSMGSQMIAMSSASRRTACGHRSRSRNSRSHRSTTRPGSNRRIDSCPCRPYCASQLGVRHQHRQRVGEAGWCCPEGPPSVLSVGDHLANARRDVEGDRTERRTPAPRSARPAFLRAARPSA